MRDTELALITALHDLITTSPAVTAAAGLKPRVYYGLPDEDAPALPYLTHSIAHGVREDVAVTPAAYHLDVWDYSDTARRIFALRGALITLLDESTITVPETTARFSLASHGLISDPEPDVRHYALSFSVRYTRAGELTALLARQEGQP